MTTQKHTITAANELQKILNRLATADTPRKLVNARREFLRFHRLIKKQVDEAYPPASGTTKKKGAWCPICKTPKRSFSALASHITYSHGWRKHQSSLLTCLCGYRSRKLSSMDGLARHFASLKNPSEHILHWEMVRATGRQL